MSSSSDDEVGGCDIPLSNAEFDGALHTVNCAASATGVAFALDYRLKAR